MVLTTGESVEGDFRADMLNGWARFYRAGGAVVEGRWQDNVLAELRGER